MSKVKEQAKRIAGCITSHAKEDANTSEHHSEKIHDEKCRPRHKLRDSAARL